MIISKPNRRNLTLTSVLSLKGEEALLALSLISRDWF